MKEGRDHDRGTEEHHPRESSSHVDLLFLAELGDFGSAGSCCARILLLGPTDLNATWLTFI
jgi:hypothetical protein